MDQILGGLTDSSAGMIFGLSSIKAAIDGLMVKNLDEKIIPGLSGIKGGISEIKDELTTGGVPALQGAISLIEAAESSSDPDEAAQKLAQAKVYLNALLVKINEDEGMLAGLDMMLAYLDGAEDTIIPGLTKIQDGLSGVGDPANPGVSEVLGTVLTGLGDAATDGTVVAGLTQVRYGLSGVGDPANPGVSEVLGTVLTGLGDTTTDGTVVGGLTQVRYGLSGTGDPSSPGVSEVLGTVLTGLGDAATEGTVVGGLTQLRGGLAGPVGDGLDGIVTGLSMEIVPGLGEIKEGMDEIMIPGTYKLLAGFNKTERVEGESGIIEGLTKISRGLANPAFTPNPGGDPGVSDGLGLVISGIRTDVLGGIGELKGGIVTKIIPGLEQMITGITGELQPGFNKVSLLLLAIWLVSMVVFLVVGILIGRSVRAKASSGSSASA
ncbi:MAG: hypothetical protein GX883_00440 [Firmicutes bacterium]|nr:hypothetical protein [Bacillota bacterium]